MITEEDRQLIEYGNYHACMTGDCPHGHANECLSNLIECFEEYAAVAKRCLAEMDLRASDNDWKQWHSKLATALRCNFVERNVSVAQATNLVDVLENLLAMTNPLLLADPEELHRVRLRAHRILQHEE